MVLKNPASTFFVPVELYASQSLHLKHALVLTGVSRGDRFEPVTLFMKYFHVFHPSAALKWVLNLSIKFLVNSKKE